MNMAIHRNPARGTSLNELAHIRETVIGPILATDKAVFKLLAR